MNASGFFRGLLFALCEQWPKETTFLAEGPTFHSAFRAMLEEAQHEPSTSATAVRMLENFDPVFGIFPEATEMLLEGERDLIVSLENPSLRYARFKMTMDEARAELNELPGAEVFRSLASRLNEALDRQN